ncbi:MAG: nascent polypeptide-associated complex protein [Candidatus Hadarchaeales archaeon]
MERMMRQMGIKVTELSDVREVIIRLKDREIIVSNPQVSLMEMAGQRTYQVTGETAERMLEEEISEEDIALVMEQTGVDREAALKALRETGGDLAQAILKLKG